MALCKVMGITEIIIARKRERAQSRWLTALSFQPGALFREARKNTQIPQKELFWQARGLPPTAASSSLLPSSVPLWGAAYSPSPTPHAKQNLDLGPVQRRAGTRALTSWPRMMGMSDSQQPLLLWAGVACSQTAVSGWHLCHDSDCVCLRVSAVTLACPHAVRWDEGVWNHSLFQADNKHVLSLHSHSIETPGSLILFLSDVFLHVYTKIYIYKHTQEVWNCYVCKVKFIISDY